MLSKMERDIRNLGEIRETEEFTKTLFKLIRKYGMETVGEAMIRISTRKVEKIMKKFKVLFISKLGQITVGKTATKYLDNIMVSAESKYQAREIALCLVGDEIEEIFEVEEMEVGA